LVAPAPDFFILAALALALALAPAPAPAPAKSVKKYRYVTCKRQNVSKKLLTNLFGKLTLNLKVNVKAQLVRTRSWSWSQSRPLKAAQALTKKGGSGSATLKKTELSHV